jgi:hypothetical protein
MNEKRGIEEKMNIAELKYNKDLLLKAEKDTHKFTHNLETYVSR